MEVVYHEDYLKDYPTAPVESPDRVACIYKNLSGKYDIIRPAPAEEEDILRVHSRSLLERVKKESRVYLIARRSAGGAILAAEIAVAGKPAFGLIRPPGHHAGPDSYWGFCFFNNISIALRKLQYLGAIGRAAILDIDLHFGDGTAAIFEGDDSVDILNPGTGSGRQKYIMEIENWLAKLGDCDIIAISAGFDQYELDWGGLLSTDDFKEIGKLVARASQRLCAGRRFAVLEGGYYIPHLGRNVVAFLEGFSGE